VQRRKLAFRVGTGAPPWLAARMNGAGERLADSLADDPEFMAAAAGYRYLLELPPDEALLTIAKLCRGVVLRAVSEQDVGIAVWYLYTLDDGLDPTVELADQILRSMRASGTAARLDRVCGRDRKRPEPDFLRDFSRKIGRITARLRREVHAEIVALTTVAEATADPSADEPEPVPEPVVASAGAAPADRPSTGNAGAPASAAPRRGRKAKPHFTRGPCSPEQRNREYEAFLDRFGQAEARWRRRMRPQGP
jgi:hypothetical protein